jgi:hypothetical protein
MIGVTLFGIFLTSGGSGAQPQYSLHGVAGRERTNHPADDEHHFVSQSIEAVFRDGQERDGPAVTTPDR